MMHIKWCLSIVVMFFAKYLVAWPLTPLVVLFVRGDGWLPGWLSWFGTPDNSMDGDGGWQTESRFFINESNKFKRYINRCGWIWRNSLYGFNRDVLSIKYKAGDTLVVIGDPNVSNGPPGFSGTVVRRLMRGGKIVAWQWYYIRQYKRWPKTCIRINLGYKLWGFGTLDRAPFVLSPSPTMHFTL